MDENITLFDLFGNTIEKKQPIDRDKLATQLYAVFSDITLEQLVGIITNKFQELVEYVDLSNGARTCQKTSLLFNPHRLSTKTKSSRLSIFDALHDDGFISGLARAILFKYGKLNLSSLLYQVLQLGINGIQYVNEFPPYLAMETCAKYDVGATSKVLDPCGGWGGRMIGVSVICNSYTCFEPASLTYAGLQELDNFIRLLNPDFKATIHCMPYEDANLQSNYYDFAITSPPYYDTEEYTSEESNSLNRYGDFDGWCSGFYFPLIENTMKALKPNGVFVLNIGDRKYPLGETLVDCYGDYFDIECQGSVLSGRAGLNKQDIGEKLYAIRKKS